MKITDIVRSDRHTLSFEVFPPKKDTDFDSVRLATEAIAELHPAFVSVTYGAGGGTSQYTLDIAKDLTEKTGVPVLAHLTCVSSSRETVRERIEAMKTAGIRNVMALRGDLKPGMETEDRSHWDYRYAVELVRDLRDSGADFCIGGACYPEIHPESASREEDLRHLREKAEAGCSFLTTQMFFDNELFYRFLEMADKAGIRIPIIPGIMPITTFSQIERSVKLSGSYLPPAFTEMADRCGTSPENMREGGIAYAVRQICDLLEHGVPNVHVYTMNKPAVAEEILDRVRAHVHLDN